MASSVPLRGPSIVAGAPGLLRLRLRPAGRRVVRDVLGAARLRRTFSVLTLALHSQCPTASRSSSMAGAPGLLRLRLRPAGRRASRDVLGAARRRQTSTVLTLAPIPPVPDRFAVYQLWLGRQDYSGFASALRAAALRATFLALRAGVEPLRFSPWRRYPRCPTASRSINYGWGARIRTWDAGVKVRCLNRLATPQ